MRILPILAAMIVISACSPRLIAPPDPTRAGPATEAPASSDETPLASATANLPPGETEMTPAPPGLQRLIEKAIAHLSHRLSIPGSEITVLEASSVTWPDASLGCPQEGMAYAQVLTPGYLLRLKAGDREFEYHASRGTEVVYCEKPMPPVEGTPGDV